MLHIDRKRVPLETLSKFSLPGILFALTLIFGFWLSHAGKPYNGWLFNVHKLIALGGVIAVVIQLTKIPNLLSPFSLVAVCLVLAAISTIALFASGALMSADKLRYALMLTIHRGALILIVLALVASFLSFPRP
jgi:hypothetical protein